MNKLKSAVCYECATALKSVSIFYLIQYIIVALLYIMGIIIDDKMIVSGLEFNTCIFVGILAVMGIKEDFKMLTQHGFSRKYNFIANISSFSLICFIMAFIDTVISFGLKNITGRYHSLYEQLYKDENIIFNILCLFAVYMFICSLMYLGALVINKIGKEYLLYIGFGLSGTVIIIITVFKYFISDELRMDIVLLLAKLIGFLPDGTINHFNPVVTFLVAIAILSGISYSIIRRIEIR